MAVVIDVDVVIVAVDAGFAVVHIDPPEFINMEPLFAVEATQAAPQSVCAKEDAPENILRMSVTLDTSHLEISMLKDVAPLNMLYMFPTLDTSHFEISMLKDVAPLNM